MSKATINIKIKMISAVTEALMFKNKNQYASDEEILKHISKFVSSEKNRLTKLAMIASASKALDIANKIKKEIINKTLKELPSILKNIDKD